jgi:hypothetical protein
MPSPSRALLLGDLEDELVLWVPPGPEKAEIGEARKRCASLGFHPMALYYDTP